MPGTMTKVRQLYENQTKRTEISLSQTENELAFEVKPMKNLSAFCYGWLLMAAFW